MDRSAENSAVAASSYEIISLGCLLKFFFEFFDALAALISISFLLLLDDLELSIQILECLFFSIPLAFDKHKRYFGFGVHWVLDVLPLHGSWLHHWLADLAADLDLVHQLQNLSDSPDHVVPAQGVSGLLRGDRLLGI